MRKVRGRIVAGATESTSKPYIHRITWAAPAADATNDIFSVTDPGTTSTAFTLTSTTLTPDFPRTITLFCTGSADISANQAVMVGTDIDDNALTETMPVFTVNTTSTVTSTKAFKTITSIRVPKHSGNGVAIGVGSGASLGLDRMCDGGVQAIVGAWKTSTGETTASAATSSTSDVSLCHVNFSTAYDASATYGCWFVTDDVR